MPNTLSAAQGQRVASVVGAVTVVAGAGMLLMPERVGPLIGMSESGPTRMLGVIDLALAPGLLRGRPRWPWLAARAVTNLGMAAFVLRRTTLPRRAGSFAVVMGLASIGDTVAVNAMRRARPVRDPDRAAGR